MFHTPYFAPSLICFVPLNFVTTLIYVSYPTPHPQFYNNTDMFRTPPHNLLEQSDLFGTPLPLPTGTGCHNVLWRHVSVCLTVGVMQNDFRILNITSCNN